jgi:hypothetical protein
MKQSPCHDAKVLMSLGLQDGAGIWRQSDGVLLTGDDTVAGHSIVSVYRQERRNARQPESRPSPQPLSPEGRGAQERQPRRRLLLILLGTECAQDARCLPGPLCGGEAWPPNPQVNRQARAWMPELRQAGAVARCRCLSQVHGRTFEKPGSGSRTFRAGMPGKRQAGCLSSLVTSLWPRKEKVTRAPQAHDQSCRTASPASQGKRDLPTSTTRPHTVTQTHPANSTTA